MLDTVILIIPRSGYLITNHDKFTPSTQGMFESPKPYFKYINNPTKEDKTKGIYKPRLTIINRGNSFDLKIEFSASKLLFDNNLDELEESDFEAVVEKLKQRANEMGVKIYTNFIKNANVSSFHPSKNIVLSQGYTSTFVIQELSKINLHGKFDLEKTSFRNNGQSLQFYANSHSFVFYDKITDLGKPEKRAIDKEQTKYQSSLFDWIKKENKGLEVLRFEIRLSKKQKMNSVLKEIGYSANPLFKDIFKKEMCQRILNLYWNKFFANNLFLFSASNKPQRMLEKIFSVYPNLKTKQAIYLMGLYALGKDEQGIRGLKSILPKEQWTRTSKDFKKFQDSKFNQGLHGFVGDIQKNLEEFEALKYTDKSKEIPKSYPLAL